MRRSLRPAGKRTRLAGLLVLSVVFAGACSSADGRDEASRQSSAQPDVNDPALQVTAPTLAFGANQTAQTITLENAGGGSLTWSARVDETWVSIQPSQGTTTTEVDWFSVNVDRAGLAAGAYAATVELETNVGSKTFSLTMNVVTPNEE